MDEDVIPRNSTKKGTAKEQEKEKIKEDVQTKNISDTAKDVLER